MLIPHITISRFNERWLVLGDVTNSTRFMRLVDQYTNGKLDDNNELLFKLTHQYNQAIETIYQQVQYEMPEQAALANTMGDGFLAVGLPGHGNPHIQYEFPAVLRMCLVVKEAVDKEMSTTRSDTEKAIQSKISILPHFLAELKLKLCIHTGYIITSVGFNRYVGECINRAARIASNAFKKVSANELVLSDEYFQLLPNDLKSCESVQSEQISLENYFEDQEADQVRVWRVPFEWNTFWQLAIAPEDSYYEYYGRTHQDDIAYLQQKLYER